MLSAVVFLVVRLPAAIFPESIAIAEEVIFLAVAFLAVTFLAVIFLSSEVAGIDDTVVLFPLGELIGIADTIKQVPTM
jgi:hypothetical protein